MPFLSQIFHLRDKRLPAPLRPAPSHVCGGKSADATRCCSSCVSGLGQGAGQLGTQNLILQSREGEGCPWVPGTSASGHAIPCTCWWSIPAVFLSQVLESVTCLLPAVLWSQAPPDSHVKQLQLGRLRGSECRFLFVQQNAKRLR